MSRVFCGKKYRSGLNLDMARPAFRRDPATLKGNMLREWQRFMVPRLVASSSVAMSLSRRCDSSKLARFGTRGELDSDGRISACNSGQQANERRNHA